MSLVDYQYIHCAPRDEYSPGDYREELRKAQRAKWSLERYWLSVFVLQLEKVFV